MGASVTTRESRCHCAGAALAYLALAVARAAYFFAATGPVDHFVDRFVVGVLSRTPDHRYQLGVVRLRRDQVQDLGVDVGAQRVPWLGLGPTRPGACSPKSGTPSRCKRRSESGASTGTVKAAHRTEGTWG